MLEYPIHFKRKGTQLPDLDHDQARYIVASNGKFIERNTPMFKTSVSVNAWDLELEPSQEYCYLRCGRMNAAMHRAMLSFFSHAHQLHRGEAALVLLYHAEHRRFLWYCPDQYVDVKATKLGWLTIDEIEFENPMGAAGRLSPCWRCASAPGITTSQRTGHVRRRGWFAHHRRQH